MAYNTNNLSMVTPQVGNADNLPRQWIYRSADTAATVNTNGYITDAVKRGMQVLDAVRIEDLTTPAVTNSYVNALNSNGSCDIVDGVAVTNTDSD